MTEWVSPPSQGILKCSAIGFAGTLTASFALFSMSRDIEIWVKWGVVCHPALIHFGLYIYKTKKSLDTH
jgi:hypothetical protein